MHFVAPKRLKLSDAHAGVAAVGHPLLRTAAGPAVRDGGGAATRARRVSASDGPCCAGTRKVTVRSSRGTRK